MVQVVLAIVAVLVFIWALSAVAGLLFWIIPWVLLGLIAGWVASKVVGSPYSLGGNILVGIAGSVIGGALFSLLLHGHTGGALSPSRVIVSILGAILLLAVMRVTGRRPLYR